MSVCVAYMFLLYCATFYHIIFVTYFSWSTASAIYSPYFSYTADFFYIFDLGLYIDLIYLNAWFTLLRILCMLSRPT